MAKKELSPAVEYLRSLELKALRSFSKVGELLTEVAGKEYSDEIMDLIDKRADRIFEGDSTNENFYYVKNSNEAGSFALTGAYDADMLKVICEYIYNHQDMFGDTILEIGCDIGIVSCFIAKTFPNAQITAIDRCSSSIPIAKHLAEKLGLTNVQFYAQDLAQTDGKYETIFSARTLHENMEGTDHIDTTLFFSDVAAQYKPYIDSYASGIAKLLDEDGDFISIERVSRDPSMYAWMSCLNDNDLLPIIDDFAQLRCQELGEDTKLQVMPFVHDTSLEDEIVYNMYKSLIAESIGSDMAEYHGWVASLVLEEQAQNLIYGYVGVNHQDNDFRFIHASLWTSKYHDDTVLYYLVRRDIGTRYLAFLDVAMMDAVKEELLMSAGNILNQLHGEKMYEIKVENGKQTLGDEITKTKAV